MSDREKTLFWILVFVVVFAVAKYYDLSVQDYTVH